MDENKQNKRPNVPPLRFPEFTDEWKRKKVSDILDFYSTNSLSWDQLEFAGGELRNLHYGMIHVGLPTLVDLAENELPNIKKDNMPKNYELCVDCDIAFADASEDTNDVAKAIELINTNGQQVVFGLHTIHGRDNKGWTAKGFKGYAFASKVFHDQIKRIAQGTKIFSINSKNFAECYIGLPSFQEQEKIAHLLSIIDRRIAVQSKLIEDLQQLKSAICKKLLSHSSWNEYIIDDICDSVSFKEYIAEVEENGSFPIIQQGETPILGYGNKKPYYNYNSVIIFGDHTLSLYKPQVPFLVATDGVKMLSPKPFVTRDFLYYLIETFMPISQGYKRHFSILKEQIVRLPSLKEQTIIGKRLSLLDTKIRIEQQLYDCYISQKQYLLGQMFI